MFFRYNGSPPNTKTPRVLFDNRYNSQILFSYSDHAVRGAFFEIQMSRIERYDYVAVMEGVTHGSRTSFTLPSHAIMLSSLLFPSIHRVIITSLITIVS